MTGPGAAHTASGLCWTAGGRAVVDGVSFAVPPGSFTGLVGPNGSGKSTVLRLLAGLRRPTSGSALLDGRTITATKRREVARRLAFVAQETSADVEASVRDVVLLGRAPHRGRSATTGEDARAVERAMAAMDVSSLADRSWSSLSGGERQRVNIARALAQDTASLLLDEPTNHLDISHRLDLMELLAGSAVTVVAALHELDLAARYCDHLVLLDAGRVAASGPPAAVLTPELLRRVYRVRATVRDGPDGRPDLRLEPLRGRGAAGAASGRGTEPTGV
ncbi:MULTISPECIES: ABC transporter ATP-binding protein [unclassified Streptomyces]|uniref:ABC transporter ATP-binding protein n=1 Tax=unclassified Streptomyces TaxID=2593676 RepID=UPI0038128409